MSKKLSVLATAYSMGEFTVADLAAKAGATPSTVQTVLNRVPEGWFVKSQMQSGTRGGQPKSYALSPEGTKGISDLLESVTVMPRLAPAQPPASEPLGLIAAREGLSDMATAKPEAAAGFRKDILGNLQWAEAEVREGSYQADAAALLREIEQLRATLDAEKVAAPVAEALELPPLPAEEPSDFLSAARVRLADLRDAVFRHLGGGSAPRPAQKLRVFISYLDGDGSSRDLASFAQGALAVARMNHGTELECSVLPLATERLNDELARTWTQGLADSAEMVFCINSEVSERAVRRALERIHASHAFKAAVVLDQSYSPDVQSFAERCDIFYEPHASQGKRLSWVEHAMSGQPRQLVTGY